MLADMKPTATEAPDGNDITHLPIPGPEQSMDLDSEGDRGGHNNEIAECLQYAQERAVLTEHSREHSYASVASHYPGQSERTMSRKRLAQRKLAAQGFTTLPDFLRQMAEKTKQQAKLDALVAVAAARPRSMQTRWQIQEEEEEAGDDSTMAKEHNSKTASALHIHKHTLETIVTTDMAQPRGFDGVTTSCIIEVASDPKPIQNDVERLETQSELSGIMSRSSSLEREHAHHIQGPSDSESCWKSSRMPVEESEESSNGCETLSDDDDPDSECPPSKTTRRSLDDTRARGIIASLIEEHRHGNVSNDAGPHLVLDRTLGCLRDRDTLHTARKELTGMAEDRKRDPILRGRIQAMVGVLNLFLEEDLHYTWRQASLIVAKSQSHGVARARSIRHWVLSFLQTRNLPHPQYSGTHSTVLEDEDISQEIQFELAQKKKTGSIKATDLVEVVASPRIQEKFNHAGINKPSISERTAHRWLSKLGWRYGKQVNGMYIDGHERADVVQYREAFMQRFKQYERRFHLWDDNGVELPPPHGFPVPEAAGRFRLILVTHDESTFFQNDQRKTCWDHNGSSKTPRPKGDGHSLMISDFLTADWGRLRDDNRCVPPQAVSKH